ncbi:MAG: hypothetical protein AAF727_09765 [Pseudomonadota bacterium]
MTGTPYDKAVAGFEALLEASSAAVHAKPMRLIQDSGQHLTTGYRHTAALEAEGFLRRDESGVYLQGTAALRTALSAFGFGRIAPVLPPVLRRLRQATQHTAFCSLTDGNDLFLGPYSQGRATKQIRLSARYRLEQPSSLLQTTPIETVLTPLGLETGTRVHTIIIPILENSEFTATIGFVLNPARMPDPNLSDALLQAAKQITP